MRHMQEVRRPCVRKVTSRKGFTLIELLVVMGIAALLMTLAATSFFGASRRDTLTKSRNQLSDVLRLARQQACILGRTHVVVCWNASTKITVGDKQVDGGKQGRYALFEYVGNVWADGKKIGAPFGLQREAFSSLARNARLININSVENDSKFMRIEKIRNDATMTDEEQGRSENKDSITSLPLEFYFGGQKDTFEVRGDDQQGNLWVATLRDAPSGLSSGKSFPLGIRTTQTYALPKDYCFNNDRVVFVFTADGRCTSAATITAQHSVAKNTPTFSVTVGQNGEINPAQM